MPRGRFGNAEYWQNVPAEEKAKRVLAKGPQGVSDKMRNENANTGAAFRTFILVGKGAAPQYVDTTPHSASVRELIKDYGFDPRATNFNDFIEQYCYPDPTGGKQEKVRTRYYNPSSTNGELIFDWTGWIQFIRKLCNQRFVKIYKTAKPADRRAQCILFAIKVYQGLFGEDTDNDPWVQFLSAFYNWYTGASSAYRGKFLINPFRHLGIIDMMNKNTKAAVAYVGRLNDQGQRHLPAVLARRDNSAFYNLFTSNFRSLILWRIGRLQHPIMADLDQATFGDVMDRVRGVYQAINPDSLKPERDDEVRQWKQMASDEIGSNKRIIGRMPRQKQDADNKAEWGARRAVITRGGRMSAAERAAAVAAQKAARKARKYRPLRTPYERMDRNVNLPTEDEDLIVEPTDYEKELIAERWKDRGEEMGAGFKRKGPEGRGDNPKRR